MNVLSLFNGMSTGHLALDNLGIPVEKYYSSEIKQHAIDLTQKKFPNTIQVGDITKWEDWDINWSEIDLVLSASPCQNLSAAGKREGIYGEKSKLFFTFVDILHHIQKVNPNVLFFQENVGSASDEDLAVISNALQIRPVRINSSLVTAQLRDRYYWSNIKTKRKGLFQELYTNIPQPKDRKIFLKDILTSGVALRDKSLCLLSSTQSATAYTDNKSDKCQKYIKSRSQWYTTIYEKHELKQKHTCLNTGSGSMGSQKYYKHRNKTTGMITLINEDYDYVRVVNNIEMCRLQGFPDDYCEGLSDVKAGNLLGDGWTLPIIEHIFSFIKLREDYNG